MSDEAGTEVEARKQGWRPESEWKGEPPTDGFKTAEQFVKDGEQVPGILRSRIDKLEEIGEQNASRIESLTQTNAEFKQYTDKQLAKEVDKNKRLIAELEGVKAQAITDGDGAAAVKADRDIQSLQPPAQEQNPELDRLAAEFTTANKWYGTDKELTEYAEFIYPRVVADGYTGKQYYVELARRVESQHPEKFKNPNRDKAGSVETDGNKEVSDSKAQTWANLPDGAKAAARQFEKDIPGFSRDDYLANYEWE